MERKMINLYIFNNKSRGALYGIGTYVQELLAAIQDSEIRLHVVNLFCDRPQIERKEEDGVLYWYFPEPISKELYPLDQKQRKTYFRNIVYLLRSYIQDQENLVFHLNSYKDESLVRELKAAFDCRMVVVTHFSDWASILYDNPKQLRVILRMNDMNKWEDLIRKSFEEERACYKAVDWVISLSGYMRELLYLDYGLTPEQVVLIPNGMRDKVNHTVNRVQLRKKWHLRLEEQMVLFVGRLDGIKGVRFLIKAFQSVLSDNPNSHLWIVGDGDYQNSLIEANPIFSRITFTGFLEQALLFELYHIADVGVVPSLFEPFGYVPLEMMMHELPIVATATSGLNEVVDTSCGLKIPLIVSADKVEIDSDLLAAKITYLLRHSEEARQLGKNGRKRYLEKYSSDMFGKNMLEFYKSIL